MMVTGYLLPSLRTIFPGWPDCELKLLPFTTILPPGLTTDAGSRLLMTGVVLGQAAIEHKTVWAEFALSTPCACPASLRRSNAATAVAKRNARAFVMAGCMCTSPGFLLYPATVCVIAWTIER